MKNISIRLFLTAAAVCTSVSPTLADQLSPAQALQRVTNTEGPRRAPAHLQLRLTEKAGDINTLYLFSSESEGGWMLVSADDTTLPLLGYADSGNIPADTDLLPPAFRWWMNEISRQVAANASAAANPAPQRVVGAAIAPMTETRWNQDEPYSLLCPEAGGRHCYTGCVATALAQVMKYHNYPPQGTGEHQYHWKNPKTEKDTVLSFDFASTKFDWSIMKDRYDHADPWESKKEVATLMYACGVAVDMWYGLGGSGASTSMVAPAMIEYFGYDMGARNYIRDYYGLDEWNQLVYDQLKEYGPVQYSGFSDTDGHSFVIDGYNTNGYFHVNWGWGGMSDGYYLLTALDPIEQGIGGAESAFDFSQDFIGNVKTEHTSTSIYPLYLMSNALTIPETEARPGEDIRIEGGVFSYSAGVTKKIMFGAAMVPASGDTIYLDGPEYDSLGVGDGVGPYDVRIPKDLKEGTYTVIPAYRDAAGVWREVPVKVGLRDSYTASFDGKTVKFAPGTTAYIEAAHLNSPESITLRKDFKVSAILYNHSDEEFYGSLCVALLDLKDPETVMTRGETVPVDIIAGDSYFFDYESEFDPKDDVLKPGEYYIAICHISGKEYHRISDLKKIDLIIDSETGKAMIEKDTLDSFIDLRGLPVAKPRNGEIYIHNGHKTIAK